jgi:tRNA U34 5-carboxymethylaminomethyl modifying enzyme MnmG/GidA
MFCISCYCNFDWKTGKIIKESEQTNEMYEDTIQATEREYMYYIRKFISYYENTKRYMLKLKADLMFFLTCYNNGISLSNFNVDKEINRRIQWTLENKRYKETYTALRPVIASVIDTAMAILGETIDDYTADRVAERIIDKGIDALRLS